MKIFLTIFLLSTSSFHLSSQELPGQHVIKMNPLYFFDETFMLSYEIFDSRYQNSFELNGGLVIGDQYYNKRIGMVIEPQYKRFVYSSYLEKNDRKFLIQGIYLSPFFHFRYIANQRSIYSGNGQWNWIKSTKTSYGIGINMGFQYELLKVLTIEPFIGGGVKISRENPVMDRNSFSHRFSDDFTGAYPRIGLKIGTRL
jgi:hypothetical protein